MTTKPRTNQQQKRQAQRAAKAKAVPEKHVQVMREVVQRRTRLLKRLAKQ